jgi:hypothetical protein
MRDACQDRAVRHEGELQTFKTQFDQNEREHDQLRASDSELFQITRQIQQQIFDVVVNRPRPEDAEMMRKQATIIGGLLGIVLGAFIISLVFKLMHF